MAGSDVAYRNLSTTLKQKREYQFLHKALSTTKHGLHQGVYLITPAGDLLTKINWGWPTPDTQLINQQLDEAIISYKAISKNKRLGTTKLSEDDRSLPLTRFGDAPNDWLKIRCTGRTYPFDDMDLFDIRHPVYNKIDKLWYTQKEKHAFVPRKLTNGFSEQVSLLPLKRILNNSYLMTSSAAWWDDHIKHAEMSMTVKTINDSNSSKVQILYEGTFEQKANNQWNKSQFNGKVLGKAIWNKHDQQFESFTWVGLGDHQISELKPNMHRGQTMKVSIATLLELDLAYDGEKKLYPHRWNNGYPKGMKSMVD